MICVAVIGKNFGDEGKGLACAGLAKKVRNTLIIKHNGGGQAGHTVEDENGKRFIHHQIGSGAEYGADTLLADTFLADLFQLGKELDEFQKVYGFRPSIYAEKDTKITIIDDVLRNMFIESARGDKRHGSCGMGINECLNRHECSLILTIKEVKDKPWEEIFDKLCRFRKEYGHKNIEAIKAEFDRNNSGKEAEYYDLLMDDEVLLNFAQCIKETAKEITLVDATSNWLSGYEQIVFETGQGLLLDNDYKIYAPHLTPSKTGLHNIAEFLDKRNMSLTEVIYLSRSYVTRHGNGPLPCECKREDIKEVVTDLTNLDNEWQGSIRYAKHENLETFCGPVIEDIESVKGFKCMTRTVVALLLTHLDETLDTVYFQEEEITSAEFERRLKNSVFDKIIMCRKRWLIEKT